MIFVNSSHECPCASISGVHWTGAGTLGEWPRSYLLTGHLSPLQKFTMNTVWRNICEKIKNKIIYVKYQYSKCSSCISLVYFRFIHFTWLVRLGGRFCVSNQYPYGPRLFQLKLHYTSLRINSVIQVYVHTNFVKAKVRLPLRLTCYAIKFLPIKHTLQCS